MSRYCRRGIIMYSLNELALLFSHRVNFLHKIYIYWLNNELTQKVVLMKSWDDGNHGNESHEIEKKNWCEKEPVEFLKVDYTFLPVDNITSIVPESKEVVLEMAK